MTVTQYLRHVQQELIHFLCLVPQDDFVGRRSISSSSVATSLMDDTSPESTVGKKSTKKICYIEKLHHSNYLRFYCSLVAVLRFAFAREFGFSFSSTAPPMFLPISSTPQPERRQTPQRRHSIEKETPTNVRQFQPPTKHSSKSLVSVCCVFSVKCIFHQMG